MFYEDETAVTTMPGCVHTLGYHCAIADGTGWLRDTIVAVTGIYAVTGRLLYRECNEISDAQDVRRQHEGIVRGVQDGRLRPRAPAGREWALERGRVR